MLGMAAKPVISPEAIQRLLQSGGDPSTMFSGDPSQPPQPAPTAPPTAPPSGTLSGAMTPPASGAPPSGMLAQSTPSFQEPQSKEDYLAAHPAPMPARPRGDFDKIPDGQPGADTWSNRHNVLRGVLAHLFGGMAEFGGDINHHPGAGEPFINRWAGQTDAQREYDRTQPVAQQEAGNKSYDQYLGQGAKSGEIEKSGVETENLRQNNPAMQRKAQFLQQLQGEAESGKYDPATLKAKYLRMAQYNRVNVMPEEIDSTISGTKPLGSKYTLTRDPQTQAPIELVDRQGNHFSESNLPKDPEAAQMWNDAKTASGQKLKVEEDKENRVAGHAATRQAQAFSNQQSMEATKKMQPAVDTALTADQRLARMEKSYTKGVAGDQQAQLALLADHLGMTFGMQKGAKLNRGLIEEAQQSQPWLAKIGAKFDQNGYLSGVALGPEQMKQMLDLGYDARDQAWKGAHDASTTYGVPLPAGADQVEKQRQPGSKPLLQQQGAPGGQSAQHVPGGQAAGLKEGATGTGTDGKKYIVKGGVWQPQ